MGVLQRVQGSVRVVIIDMSDVPMMDMTGMVALESLLSRLAKGGVSVVISNLSPRIRQLLDRAGIDAGERLHFCDDLQCAREQALSFVDRPSVTG
jgi:SulP family sulfate permease